MTVDMDEIFGKCKKIVDNHYPKLKDNEKVDAVSRLSAQVWFQLFGVEFSASREKFVQQGASNMFQQGLGQIKDMMRGK